MDAQLLRLATQAVIVPTWFLATYLVIVALVPVTARLHRRFGLAVPVVLVVLAVLVDAAHLAGVPAIGFVNYVLVWGAVHQAGYLWADGRLPRSVAGALALFAAGLAALCALVFLAGYPVSMVGVDGAARTNTGPPTIALVALGAAQVGLVLALRKPAERLLARPRVWASVVRAGALTMTVYLWHMTALVAGAALLVATGVWSGVSHRAARRGGPRARCGSRPWPPSSRGSCPSSPAGSVPGVRPRRPPRCKPPSESPRPPLRCPSSSCAACTTRPGRPASPSRPWPSCSPGWPPSASSHAPVHSGATPDPVEDEPPR